MSVEVYSGALADIFLNDVRLIDVRAPVEFNEGAFPSALNFPLLDDEQRRRVGICYKHSGPDAAVALGYRLVTPESAVEKAVAWAEAVREQSSLLYCFRGGMRSQLVQTYLRDELGLSLPLIAGGYKRLRRYLLDTIVAQAEEAPMLMISGNTGCGKTEILAELQGEGYRTVDLEGAAAHRGSAFGKQQSSQPTQINFENHVAISLLKSRQISSSLPEILIEDECACIGLVTVPRPLFDSMRRSPIFLVRASLESRMKLILRDYVAADWATFSCDAEHGLARFRQHIAAPLERIRKGLGGKRYQELMIKLDLACQHLDATGSLLGFTDLIEGLLVGYYDPLYERNLMRRADLIIGEGSRADFKKFLIARSSDRNTFSQAATRIKKTVGSRVGKTIDENIT